MDAELKYEDGKPAGTIELTDDKVVGHTIDLLQERMEMTLNDLQWTLGFYGARYYEITRKPDNMLSAVSRALYVRCICHGFNNGINIHIPDELTSPLLIPQTPTLDMMSEQVARCAKQKGSRLYVPDDGVDDEFIAMFLGVNATSAARWRAGGSRANPAVQRLAIHIYSDIARRGVEALNDYNDHLNMEAKLRGFKRGFRTVAQLKRWTDA